MTEKKILIIEDDEELQTLYGLYLQGQSFEITQAFNGEEGLKRLEACKPDLIVLDMIMPKMDGEAFLCEFKKHEDFKSIPIIIASVNEKIPRNLLAIRNIYTVLRKPFSINELVEKVHEAVD